MAFWAAAVSRPYGALLHIGAWPMLNVAQARTAASQQFDGLWHAFLGGPILLTSERISGCMQRRRVLLSLPSLAQRLPYPA
jgi:hypothetical protein